MSNFIDLTGEKFGKLTVMGKLDANEHGQYKWLCECECGNRAIVFGYHLRNHHTSSCGCLVRETSRKMGQANRKHGHEGSRLYNIWRGMKSRCHNPNNKDYKSYGDRGIKVYPDWYDFHIFLEWAIDSGYSDNKSIDRLDVNGDYCPENCRWATTNEQSNNKRTSRYLTHEGHTHTVGEWAKLLNIPYATLYRRLFRYGWNIERAFTKR